jgi:cytochrome P450 family 12
MYCLAKNPDKQEKLRAELFGIMPNENTPLCEENMKNLPYLRAVIKETLRLYPPATANMRRTNENLVLQGFKVPKGVDILMGMMPIYRDAKYFEKPLDFVPERFLRGEINEDVCPRSLKQSHPFGKK